MTEPDVTITDYLLTVEALAFAMLIGRSPAGTPLQAWFVCFFAATALASLAGGTVHGFFAATPSVLGTVLWRAVLVSLGVVSTSAWTIGARLLFADPVARLITAAAWVELAGYALLVVFVTDAFSVAIINYLPATLFLLVAFLAEYRSSAATPLAPGVAGLLLTLVAAGVQQTRIAIHPTYFNHNALYHLLQAIALFLIFRAAVFLTSR